MDRAVEAPVTAVGVAVEILTEQAVVERGVEDGAIVAAAAGDADLPERAVPCGARCRLCRLDAGARRAFAIQLGAGTPFVDIGAAAAHLHRRLLCGVEGNPAAGPLATRRQAPR